MGTKKVKAVRAFMYKGKAVGVGDVIELPSVNAIEVIASNKAEAVVAEIVKPVIVTEPLEIATIDTATVKPQAKGGRTNVR